MIDNEKRERLRALYDAAPYPEVLANRQQANQNPLLAHWVNALHGYENAALMSGRRLLVAGCGSGAEAVTLSRAYPLAEVVGVDFSERSIERARVLGQGLTNLHFEVADLMDEAACAQFAPFDFVLCHGVADYVSDPAQLMRTFARCLSERGVLYLSLNTPQHPAQRIRSAFAALGLPTEGFADGDEERAALQMLARLMGSDSPIPDLGNAPKAYLDIDIFAPIAHHDAIEVWIQRAEAAGLHFGASMDAMYGLTELSDEHLPMLYGMDKARLSLFMSQIRRRPSAQMLFTPTQCARVVDFADEASVWAWQPRLDACLGVLPDLEAGVEASEARNLLLRFSESMQFGIYSSAYDLAVFRRCDGSRSIGDICASIAQAGDAARLRACLFRAYHYGLLR